MKQIDVLNSKLLSSVDETFPIGLFTGKLGLCIYYYYLSRWEEKEEFKQTAEKLLDDITSQLSGTMKVTVEFGLAGIAIGISYLTKEKFIEGDINEILEEMDSSIYKRLAFFPYKETKKIIPKADFVQLLYYLYSRCIEQTSSDGKYIFQELIIRTIEMFKHELQADFFNECFSFSIRDFHLPFFLYTISKIYELNIYNDRITKILEENINQIISIYPASQANRLYLLCGLINIRPCLPDYKKEIDSHIRLVKEGIDIDYIINFELRDQDIYNGRSIFRVHALILSSKGTSGIQH